MTRATKEKLFNKKNLRMLIIASVCILTICVAILPVVAFRYTKNKLGVTPPVSEEGTNLTNTTPPVVNPEAEPVVWASLTTDLFNYLPVENSANVYISGIKENAVIASNYVILPHELTGESKIVGVADNAFCDNESIKGLVLPNTYTYIGENAFKGNVNLRYLVIGNTMEETAEALENRDKMIVKDNAFQGCTGLESLTIGVSVGAIGESFSRCTELKEIIIYSKDVYEGAFVKTSFGGAFEICPKVMVYSDAYTGQNPYFSKFYTMGQSVLDGKSYTEYSLVDVLYEIKLNANGGAVNAETIKYEPNKARELPSPVLSHYDFCGWYKTSDFSGEPVESISEDTKGCFSLYAKWEPTEYAINYVMSGRVTNAENPETFNINSDDITFAEPTRNGYLFGGWFKDSGYNEKVEKLSDLLGSGETTSVTIYAKFDAMFTGSGTITGLTNNVEVENLKSITIPSDIDGLAISSIDMNAFSGLLLEEVIIDANITSIGKGAFKDCTSLRSVVFNSPTLTTIGEDAFSGCTALESVSFGNLSVLSLIGNSAFKNCVLLKTVDLRNCSLLAINYEAFKGCSSLETVYLSGNVRDIGVNAFSGCTKLSNINWSGMSNLTNIKEGAFENCTSLVSIEFPRTVSSIKEGAFKGCTGLKVVNLSNAKLTKLSASAFENCTSLQSVSFKEKLEVIDSSAFKNCTKLTEVVLPATLTQIGVDAFAGTGLQKVTFTDTDNWYLVETVEDELTELNSLDLLDDSSNAVNLKGDYTSKILVKSSSAE